MREKLPEDPTSVGLPPRMFLYTTDQIAYMVGLDEATMFRRGYFHLDGVSVGTPSPDLILARDIAPPGQDAVWRVSDQELVRWSKRKGFHWYIRGWAKK